MDVTSPPAPATGPANAAGHRPARPKKKVLANPLMIKRPKATQPAQRPPTAPNATQQRPNSNQSPPAPPRTTFTERPRSPTPEGAPTVYQVYMSQRSILEGFRHHVARMQSKGSIDVTDESVFTRPVKLHRRDPNAKLDAPGEELEEVEKRDEEDDKERERNEAIKAERQRIREETAKMIAPSVKKKKPMVGKKKVEAVRGLETAEDEKRRMLKYEEALPWHLEDFDNNQTWAGTYEAALSDCHIMLVANHEDKSFRVVPLEKWYRFRERGKFKHLDSDEVEAIMKQRVKEPRWLLAHKQRDEMVKQREKAAQKSRGMFTRSGEKAANDGELFGLDEEAGEEEIDFDQQDLFDDDDEQDNPFDDVDDQEEKDAKQRIKKEQLNANIFSLADEKEVDDEEERTKQLAQLQRQLEKGTRKVLVKQEKNHLYDDSDEENPYTSESEEESNPDAEEEKKDGKPGEQAKLNGDKSGASTKGENTPSDRKKNIKGTKRAGSPNLSEASGNESTRKKAKLNILKRTADVDASGASGNESSYKNKKRLAKAARGPPQSLNALGAGRSGSGSESESARRSRLDLSARGTPAGSRAQSPFRGAPNTSKTNTRASSPDAAGASKGGAAEGAAKARGKLPSHEEILAAVPDGGISITDLSREFKSYGLSPEERRKFIITVRGLCDIDKVTKWIRRRKT